MTARRGHGVGAQREASGATTDDPRRHRTAHRVPKRVGDDHRVLGETRATSALSRPGVSGASMVTIT